MMSTDGNELSFELLDRPLEWAGSIAFGRLTDSVIETGGARIRLSIVGNADQESHGQVPSLGRYRDRCHHDLVRTFPRW